MTHTEGSAPQFEETGHTRAGAAASLAAAGGLTLVAVLGNVLPAAAETASVNASCDSDGTVLIEGKLDNDTDETFSAVQMLLSVGGGADIGDIAPGTSGQATVDLGVTSTSGGSAEFIYDIDENQFSLFDEWGALDCEEEPSTTTTTIPSTTVPSTTTTEGSTTTTTGSTTTTEGPTTTQGTTTTTEGVTTTTEGTTTTTEGPTSTTLGSTTTTQGETTTTGAPTTTANTPPQPPVATPPGAAKPVEASANFTG